MSVLKITCALCRGPVEFERRLVIFINLPASDAEPTALMGAPKRFLQRVRQGHTVMRKIASIGSNWLGHASANAETNS